MNRPTPLHPNASSAARWIALAVIGLMPAAAHAATAASVTLSVTSTVDAPPATCLVSPDDAGADPLPSATFSFNVACSGPGPYVVAIDGASELMPAETGRRDAAGSQGAGAKRTFTLPLPANAINSPDRTPLRSITAIIQY